ncbi:unnamed protein product [Schistosoma curassoni]|uniref:Uncharacterized protein n=1 Tax=Schistosoma curassoni TaxID=6186 RepID=A0A183KZ07_9TREM|nr:unnamed protein product [Schistosoma curassoni]
MEQASRDITISKVLLHDHLDYNFGLNYSNLTYFFQIYVKHYEIVVVYVFA